MGMSGILLEHQHAPSLHLGCGHAEVIILRMFIKLSAYDMCSFAHVFYAVIRRLI